MIPEFLKRLCGKKSAAEGGGLAVSFFKKSARRATGLKRLTLAFALAAGVVVTGVSPPPAFADHFHQYTEAEAWQCCNMPKKDLDSFLEKITPDVDKSKNFQDDMCTDIHQAGGSEASNKLSHTCMVSGKNISDTVHEGMGQAMGNMGISVIVDEIRAGRRYGIAPVIGPGVKF